MNPLDKPRILLVDDDPAKLLTYEVMLKELDQSLVKAVSGREALNILLSHEVAVILMDVNMPDIDGFQLATLIRDHPRYNQTAIIFVSAVNLTEADYLRGYQMGGVDYVSVPVLPDVLRAKVKVFVELYRKTRELEAVNASLETKVAERTEELRQSNERQMILAREVDHRAKNALAVAQAIVRLTEADDIENYVAAVEGRISSLARAHALLSEARWEGASIRRLVEEEVAPYQGASCISVSLTGPDLILKPGHAQAIALALHELATNAAKYGCFSIPHGSLAVAWEAGTVLRISWLEGGMENVTPPTRAGFGTRVISLGIERQLGGRVTYDWKTDGVFCSLTIPLERQTREKEVHQARLDGTRNAILVVEDEPLVSLLIERSLLDIGYEVLGPYNKLQDALMAAEKGDYVGAVLDVNLNGELVFPLADLLSRRAIPYLFTTGYTPERIDPRFASVAVLQKPVDSDTLQTALKKCVSSGRL